VTEGSALLNVTVPPPAKLFVNGRATTSIGASRRYVAHGLQPNLRYTFELRAEDARDGRQVSETKSVTLQANQSADVAFRLDAAPARTSLTVHVPEDSRLWLEGNATRGTGAVRQFETTRLSAGQSWEDYEVRVEIERDGRTLAQRKTITLKAGQSHEMRFDFDRTRLAATPPRVGGRG
jgi:uncharacterized protein (TIGR03000 family)